MKTVKKTRAQALFSAHPPALTLPIQHTYGPFPRSNRTLQLRGPLLLISKTKTPTPSDKLLLLQPHTPPLSSGDRCVSLQGHKLYFENGEQRDSFMDCAREVLEATHDGASKYVVLSRLGSGASGVVHLVKRRFDEDLFAMKCVDKSVALKSETQLQRLILERMALTEAAERNSPFIVRLVDVFENGSQLCFVTEFARYGDLRALVRKVGRFSEDVAKKLFTEIVLGLEEVHEMGFLYRDLKLGNLLLCGDGHVRLADFGLVKRVGKEGRMGRAKSFVGTRRYMSPEHLDVGREDGYGVQSDLWALGVCLYVMVTGQYPFAREVNSRDAKGVFEAVLKEEVVYPGYLSEEVVEVLRGLLDRDEGRRWGLEEVKECKWLKGICFEQVTKKAVQKVREEDVLKEIRDGGRRNEVAHAVITFDCGSERRSLSKWMGLGGRRVAVL